MAKKEVKSKWAKNEEKKQIKRMPKKKAKPSVPKKLSNVTFLKEKLKNPYEFFIYARVSKKQEVEANEIALDKDKKILETKKESSLKSQVDFMKEIADREGITVRKENIIEENKS